MSQNSKIEWTDHTFNPWWGCQKVSAGCKNCYAETLDNRWKGGHWGSGSDRKPMSEKYWAQPLKWNDDARKAGVNAKVFCASMADVFEDHPDVDQRRRRLFEMIEETDYLTWMLLTKRPENILRFLPTNWTGKKVFDEMPPNLWIGTSVESQETADERITLLLRVPAAVRFLSCEPLLGPVDLTEYIVLTETNENTSELAEARGWGYNSWSGGFDGPGENDSCYDPKPGIHWVIAGGESGPHARPMHPDWARSLRDQCQAAGVSFFFKQWGEWRIYDHEAGDNQKTLGMFRDGVFEHGNVAWDHRKESVHMAKVGKKLSGRLLDGREWNEFPNQVNQ